mmetsp:Transcript_41183/g.65274  ORF Transcript_41183/g.65274 Transcript_41183/m.65274 type:complete len:260 (+) Transcript_41183:930-1709(+)
MQPCVHIRSMLHQKPHHFAIASENGTKHSVHTALVLRSCLETRKAKVFHKAGGSKWLPFLVEEPWHRGSIESIELQGPHLRELLHFTLQCQMAQLYHHFAICLHGKLAITDAVVLPIQWEHEFHLRSQEHQNHASIWLVGQDMTPELRTAPATEKPRSISTKTSRLLMFQRRHQGYEQVGSFDVCRDGLNRCSGIRFHQILVNTWRSSRDLRNSKPIKEEIAVPNQGRPFARELLSAALGDDIHVHLNLPIHDVLQCIP